MKAVLLTAGLLGTLTAASPVLSYPRLSTHNDRTLEALERRQAKCSAVHIVVARASTEPQGEGLIGALSRSVKSAIPGTTSEAVKYPAALAPYGPSEIKGVVAAKAQVTEYVKKCPESKIVLMGYSQVRSLSSELFCLRKT